MILGAAFLMAAGGGLAVLEPPPEYVHPYRGHVVEEVMPLVATRDACRHRGLHADACSWVSQGDCYIVIPNNGPVPDIKAYRRHEIAHCLGWNH